MFVFKMFFDSVDKVLERKRDDAEKTEEGMAW